MTPEEFVTMATWVLSLTPEALPPIPFELRPGVRVIGPGFLTTLQADLRDGFLGPRMAWGALATDCADLWRVLNEGKG